jgi:hypothetical protein
VREVEQGRKGLGFISVENKKTKTTIKKRKKRQGAELEEGTKVHKFWQGTRPYDVFADNGSFINSNTGSRWYNCKQFKPDLLIT